MNDSHQSIDPIRALAEYAEQLNAISSPAESPRVSYENMSGGLVWSDETNREMPVEVIWALRGIWAYRTSLMLGSPRDELKDIWEQAQSLIPKWVGFRMERRQSTPELLAVYRRGVVTLKKCLRDLEQKLE